MTLYPHTADDAEKVLERFGTSISSGLSSGQAEERLARAGPNEIVPSRVRWWQIALRQFRSAFIYLLLIAAGIVFAIGERTDAAVILSFVLINAVLGFLQEYRSEKSIHALQQLIRPKARALRDARWQTLDTRVLVPGDVVRLETGDIVPADLRLVRAENLQVDESILTGESAPVPKHANPLQTAPPSIYECDNLCFSGTSVAGGCGVGVVIETGIRTAMGRVAQLTGQTARESEFSKNIGRFSQFILRMIFVTLAFVFVANVLIEGEQADVVQLAVFSIALVVSVIPEALPVITTISLSHGALRLAKGNVVVKRLTAIEDIGGIEVLCSDKTGTLTENRLKVTCLSPGAHTALMHYAAMTFEDADTRKEPFSIAIMEAAGAEVLEQARTVPRLAELPFDPHRRRNSVLVRENERTVLVVRGAPEELLRLSPSLPDREREELLSWISERGREGERTLALAKRSLPPETRDISPEDECDLEFLGAIAFQDPIKPSAYRAVEKAAQLGVKLKILTGDAPDVAGAVGVRIGLIGDPSDVITGSQLMALTPHERERAILEHEIFARVTPEQKYQIIQTLQGTHSVGFLGEGINDAPALRLAGVSLVVDSAADIAREAADIIILQKNLEVIIDGIRNGRIVFANTVKYLKATLASNFGNFYAIAIVSLFIAFLPMLPIQILLVNLVTDFPMIAIATDQVDEAELNRPRRYELREIALVAVLLGVVSTVFDFMFFAVFAGKGAGVLQTNWFMGSVLTEVVFLLSIRSKLPFFRASRPSVYLAGLSAIAAAVALLLPFTRLGQTVFSFTPPTGVDLLLILVLVAGFFICAEMVKHFYYRYQ